MPDRLLEWAHKITCQLTPKGPSQEGTAQPFKTWHSQFPGTFSHTCWKCHMFRINKWIFGTMKTHLFASWSQGIHFVFSMPKGVSWFATAKTCLAWSCLSKMEIQQTRGKCRGRRVGGLVCECQCLAGLVVPFGWLQLSGEEGSRALAVKAGFQEEDYNLPPN